MKTEASSVEFVVADAPFAVAAMDLPPPSIAIQREDGRMLVNIKPDGTLEYGDGYTPDEAAQTFWKAMAHFMPAAWTPQHGDAVDAAKWRALIDCARIRPLGSAGLDQDGEDRDYGHLGLDLWTKHGPEHEAGFFEKERALAIRWLDRFIEKALRVKRAAG